jgi:hypothetical protein
MALSVKRITLWRAEVENQPGVLARTLEPLARAGADLRVVMGYRFPQAPERAAIELYPVVGKKATTMAGEAGLSPSEIPCLLVEGDNRPGLGAAIGRALADAGLNLAFVIAQVIGRKFTATIGFDDGTAAATAVGLIKRAAKPAARTKRSRR